MATTTRWALPYPVETDEPDGAGQMQALAEALDGHLGKAIPIANAAARPASPTRGLIVHQDDDDGFYGYTGSLWTPLSGSSGGGGGSTASAHYTAGSTAQSIPTTADTVVAFGTEGDADALVTRAVQDAGHVFTLESAGIWAISTTVRYATNPAGGERAVSLRTVGGLTLAHAGGAQPGLPATYSLACTRYLAEDTQIIVVCYQGTGAGRLLEPNSGAWVQISLALVG